MCVSVLSYLLPLTRPKTARKARHGRPTVAGAGRGKKTSQNESVPNCFLTALLSHLDIDLPFLITEYRKLRDTAEAVCALSCFVCVRVCVDFYPLDSLSHNVLKPAQN